MESGVYKITNLVNGKFYIGSTSRPLSVREGEHWYDLKKNDHANIKLQNSWNKHGEENFKFEALIYCHPIYCQTFEQYYIDILKPILNINLVASIHFGDKRTTEQRINFSKVKGGKQIEIYENNILVYIAISTGDCSDFIKCNRRAIYAALNGKRNTIYKKYRIKYVGEDFSFTPKKRIQSQETRDKIAKRAFGRKISKQNREAINKVILKYRNIEVYKESKLVGEYPTITHLAASLQLNRDCVSHAIRDKKIHKGFNFIIKG